MDFPLLLENLQAWIRQGIERWPGKGREEVKRNYGKRQGRVMGFVLSKKIGTSVAITNVIISLTCGRFPPK